MEYPIIDTLTNAYIRNGWTGLIITEGKNLINYESLSWTNGIRDDNGNLTTGSAHFSSYIPVKPNTVYTISGSLYTDITVFRLYFSSNNYEWISRTAGVSNTPYTFTTPNNCYYIQIQVRRAYYLNDAQLEEGSEATPYEPYYATTDIFFRTRLPLIRYFPHPVIDSLQRASDGTMTADDVQVLRHYLTKFGIGNIELGRFHAINLNISDDIREIDMEPIPIDNPIKEKKTGEEDLNVKTE